MMAVPAMVVDVYVPAGHRATVGLAVGMTVGRVVGVIVVGVAVEGLIVGPVVGGRVGIAVVGLPVGKLVISLTTVQEACAAEYTLTGMVVST